MGGPDQGTRARAETGLSHESDAVMVGRIECVVMTAQIEFHAFIRQQGL